MNRQREIENHFSWLPPPATVIKLRDKNSWPQNSKQNDKFGSLEQLANHERTFNPRKEANHWPSSRESPQDKNEEGRNAARPNGDRLIDGVMQEEEKKRHKYTSELEKPKESPKLIVEEEVELKSVKNAESAIFLFADEELDTAEEDHNCPDSGHALQVSTRKFSGSEHYHVGKNEVDVDNLMRSRKKSEFHPSQKFLSLSFQNYGEIDEEDGDENANDAGAVYLKRLDPGKFEKQNQNNKARKDKKKEKEKIPESEKEKRKMEKREEKQRKEFEKQQRRESKRKNREERKNNNLFVEGDKTQGNSFDGNKMVWEIRKKSVFTSEDIDRGPVDVEEILNRKKSTASHKEKFLSMSFEKHDHFEDGKRSTSPPLNSRGGLYAKRIANK